MREAIALREAIHNAEASGRSKQNARASHRMREAWQPWYQIHEHVRKPTEFTKLKIR